MGRSKKSVWVDFKAVKEAVTMEMILDRYGIELNRKGDQLTGACPIHEGSNPGQFSVSLNKNAFHCFSSHCGAKGNILDFVARMEDVSIREAALLIQEWFEINTGKDPPEEREEDSPKKEQAEPKGKKENELLTFRLKNLDPEHSYLKARGLEPETIEYFGLGYCSKGIMAKRIAIPIHDEGGALVAYAGRTVEDVSGKNSKYRLPASFKKAFVVFNIHQVKERHLVLVEGFFDVFNLWQEGILNAVALMGSSMSKEQEELIIDHIGEDGRLTLMFDGDQAGQSCTKEVVERLIQKAHIKVINLKEGEQPDKLSKEEIQKHLG
ncbi:CHC2 zinc finger domain-containing protein [Thermodesulfobacteriota bacterium]